MFSILVCAKKEMGTETASTVVVSLQFNKTVLKSGTCLVSTATLGIFNEHRQLGLVIKVFGF